MSQPNAIGGNRGTARLWEDRTAFPQLAPRLDMHAQVMVACDAADRDLLPKVPVGVAVAIAGDWAGRSR